MKLVSISLLILFSVSIFAQNVKDKDGKIIKENQFKTTPSGLKYYIYENKKTEKPRAEDKVKVHYIGKFLNDTVFDTSYKRGEPLEFQLGVGQVIKGWDEGIALLGKGERAVLVIPPGIAYGSTDRGSIPANSTLIFEVELIDFTKAIQIAQFDTKGKDTLTTESGLKYIVVEKGSGLKAEKETVVAVHYSGYLKDGKMFDSSVKRGEPIQFELGMGQVIKGWEEGLTLMHEGDKFRLIIPYVLAYGEAGRPPIIPEKSDLIFDVELLKVVPAVKINPFDISGKSPQITESGLKYIFVQKGRGRQAADGMKVKVHYTGYLADGKIFDSSVKRGQPIEFTLGSGQVIKGWDEGIKLMAVGDKARFIIPFELAYGENGYPGVIPPKAELTFDVELVSVE